MARKAKAPEAAAPAAPPGAPSNAQTLKTLRELGDLKVKLDEANGVYRARLKKAKADGEDTKELLKALNDRKVDRDQLDVSLKRYLHYRALLGMPVNQGSLFTFNAELKPEDREKQHVWDVESAGYDAGRHGAARTDNRHPAGSIEHQAWDRGYMSGQAAIARELGKNARKASTRADREAQTALPGTDAAAGDGKTGEGTEGADGADGGGKPAKAKRGRPKKAAGEGGAAPRRGRAARTAAVDPDAETAGAAVH